MQPAACSPDLSSGDAASCLLHAFNLRTAEINFVVLDKNGNLLGVNRTQIDNLSSGARREVRTTWPEPLKGDIASIEIDPRVNVFDPTIILKPQ